MFFVKAEQFITAIFGCNATGYRFRRGLFILAAGLCSTPAFATPVEFQFKDNRLPGTTLYLAIYEAAKNDNWNEQAEHQVALKLGDENPWTTIIELPEGRYAARAFIDTDKDGILKTARSGRPLEPFSISLGDGRKQPSIRFQQAIFTVKDQPATVSMQLLYPRGSDQQTPDQ